MNLASHLTHPVFKRIGELADERGQRAFVIGGFVRDLMLDRPCKDIDIVTEGSGIELARATAQRMGIKQVHVFKNFGTAMFKAATMKWSSFKKKATSRQSQTRGGGWNRRRQIGKDFTINAMAISLNADSFGKLVDPFGGWMIWTASGFTSTPTSPTATTLRMMRGVRFASQRDFELKMAASGNRRNAGRPEIISAERIHTELNKIARPQTFSWFQIDVQDQTLASILPRNGGASR